MPEARRDSSCFRLAPGALQFIRPPARRWLHPSSGPVHTDEPSLRSGVQCACSWHRSEYKCRPKLAEPPAHAVIKYLSAELHETPNRSPVMASHNHEPDSALHLSRHIAQGADCSGQGRGEPRGNARWRHQSEHCLHCRRIYEASCPDCPADFSLVGVLMAPRQQVYLIFPRND